MKKKKLDADYVMRNRSVNRRKATEDFIEMTGDWMSLIDFKCTNYVHDTICLITEGANGF